MTQSPAKRMILAVGFAGIAATGAIAGAQLKADREKEAAKTVILRESQSAPQSTTSSKPAEQDFTVERIAALENQRGQLLMQRHGVQKKLDAFEERKRLNAEKEARRDGAREVIGMGEK